MVFKKERENLCAVENRWNFFLKIQWMPLGKNTFLFWKKKGTLYSVLKPKKNLPLQGLTVTFTDFGKVNYP